mmetsp:Transcript_9888/g.30313  ORF Transcript_9888/g.30313 Transcript_9888/m.30313 type:complete len:220 (-) Transcript_9888:85-744(-)
MATRVSACHSISPPTKQLHSPPKQQAASTSLRVEDGLSRPSRMSGTNVQVNSVAVSEATPRTVTKRVQSTTCRARRSVGRRRRIGANMQQPRAPKMKKTNHSSTEPRAVSASRELETKKPRCATRAGAALIVVHAKRRVYPKLWMRARRLSSAVNARWRHRWSFSSGTRAADGGKEGGGSPPFLYLRWSWSSRASSAANPMSQSPVKAEGTMGGNWPTM